jgi:hypothetical protein
MTKALCLLLPISLFGCFDVELVEPGTEVEPLLVDDFESADRLPEPPFQKWACRAFQPEEDPTGVEECAFKPGNGSFWSFMGAFRLHDEDDDVTEFVGASLSTNATRPLDLRRYREISLDVKFVPGDLAVANSSNFYVELTCRSARSGGVVGGSAGDPFSVSREVHPVPAAWDSLRVSLDELVQPPWQDDRIDGSVPACLARVDSIAFVLSTTVGDGRTGQVQLYLDDVSFE